MNNFGVVEVASERRSVAPGWAYVPDTTPAGYGAAAAAAAAAAAQAVSASSSKPRKRAARSQGGRSSAADLSSRQAAKVRKELELLDRDGGAGAAGARDAAIPIPAKAIKAPSKHTPNVRKILASQKTFANHLDDFNALSALHENSHAHNLCHASTPDGAATPRRTTTAAAAAAAEAKTGGKRPAKKNTRPAATKRGGGRAARSASNSISASASADTPMPDADEAADPIHTAEPPPLAPSDTTTSAFLRAYTGPRPPPHPLDGDPLLASRMPPRPDDETLRALRAQPPLTYPEAQAAWAPLARAYPARVFCEACGYWGRVKCTKCGTPVCALGCLEVHREECITRYGL